MRRALPGVMLGNTRARRALPGARRAGNARRTGVFSRVAFLGAMRGLLHSRALLPLIPPAPFSHAGRRGSLGVLLPETGDGTQGRAKTSTPFFHKGRREGWAS